MQLPLVFNAIEKYEKDGFVHVLSEVLKPMMSIDAPKTANLYRLYAYSYSRIKVSS